MIMIAGGISPSLSISGCPQFPFINDGSLRDGILHRIAQPRLVYLDLLYWSIVVICPNGF